MVYNQTVIRLLTGDYMKCRKCLKDFEVTKFGEYKLRSGKITRRKTCQLCMNEIGQTYRHKLIGKQFEGMNKQCKYCEILKPINQFEPARSKCQDCRQSDRQRSAKCSKESIRYATEWNKNHPERRRKTALNYYYKLQNSAILAYGGYKCACCGVTEPLFLNLDHVRNDGKSHREMLGTLGGAKLYKWLRDNNYPEGFQVLCSNCNHGKSRNKGICPHQVKRNDYPEREYSQVAGSAPPCETGEDIVCSHK